MRRIGSSFVNWLLFLLLCDIMKNPKLDLEAFSSDARVAIGMRNMHLGNYVKKVRLIKKNL